MSRGYSATPFEVWVEILLLPAFFRKNLSATDSAH